MQSLLFFLFFILNTSVVSTTIDSQVQEKLDKLQATADASHQEILYLRKQNEVLLRELTLARERDEEKNKILTAIWKAVSNTTKEATGIHNDKLKEILDGQQKVIMETLETSEMKRANDLINTLKNLVKPFTVSRVGLKVSRLEVAGYCTCALIVAIVVMSLCFGAYFGDTHKFFVFDLSFERTVALVVLVMVTANACVFSDPFITYPHLSLNILGATSLGDVVQIGEILVKDMTNEDKADFKHLCFSIGLTFVCSVMSFFIFAQTAKYRLNSFTETLSREFGNESGSSRVCGMIGKIWGAVTGTAAYGLFAERSFFWSAVLTLVAFLVTVAIRGAGRNDRDILLCRINNLCVSGAGESELLKAIKAVESRLNSAKKDTQESCVDESAM